jgi:hypothetical protein
MSIQTGEREVCLLVDDEYFLINREQKKAPV